MRRRDAKLPLLLAAGLLALGVVVLLARRAFRQAAQAAAPAPKLEPPDAEKCANLAKQYASAWEARNRCERDDDCVASPRGELFTALDGCARFGPRKGDLKFADALAAQWLSAGCADAYEICDEKAEAVCRAGRCNERPPPPLPASWNRIDVERDFHFFLPPELKEIPIQAEEGHIYVWRGERMGVSLDYSGWGSQLDEPEVPPPLRVVSREKITVSGEPAVLRVIEGMPVKTLRGPIEPWTSVGLHIPHVRHSNLTLSVRCKGSPPCPDGDLVVHSLKLRRSTPARP